MTSRLLNSIFGGGKKKKKLKSDKSAIINETDRQKIASVMTTKVSDSGISGSSTANSPHEEDIGKDEEEKEDKMR